VVPGGSDVPSGAKYSAAEVELAAKTAYFEARGKGEAAYRAVICVIANRVESSKYGGGVTSVKTEVYRQSQFTVVNHSDFESTTPPDEIIGYANDVLNNNNRSIPADVFFFRAEKEDKTWGSRVFYKTIGGNDFYYGG
jgi:spore germination cell wall hydrolase CwlJ-like protein